MDDGQFDALTRTLATGATRRRLMGFLAGSGTAALIGVRSILRTSAAPPTAQGEPVGTGVANTPACEDIDCPQGLVVDPETCTCDCAIDCPPNRAPDPNTCTCYCTLSDSYVCPRPDQVYDDDACLCVCNLECNQPGKTLDQGDCACVCIDDDCPGDAIFDPDTCTCSCPPNLQSNL
jgi:hypothetical protein